MANCDCQDWQKVLHDHSELFQIHPEYGCIIAWLEITNEGTYHKTHHYGIKIQHCPFCGSKLKCDTEF
jgi:hypothetical protein